MNVFPHLWYFQRILITGLFCNFYSLGEYVTDPSGLFGYLQPNIKSDGGPPAAQRAVFYGKPNIWDSTPLAVAILSKFYRSMSAFAPVLLRRTVYSEWLHTRRPVLCVNRVGAYTQTALSRQHDCSVIEVTDFFQLQLQLWRLVSYS